MAKNSSETLPAKEGPPKPVIELRELDEIYNRFKNVFILTNVLTILLGIYVIARLLFPEHFEIDGLRRLQTLGLCGLLSAMIILSVAQWLCLRQTTLSSRRKIEELTFRDALTNVYNYRYMDRRLDGELRIMKRFQGALSVVYVDLDSFKRVNDECGHQLGSMVLSEIGRLLKLSARTTDLVGRMGGDEFLAILPNTARDEALIVSERIRHRFETHIFDVNGRKVDYLRASLGVASFPYDAQNKEALIAAADQAMYRAKQAGGNRVCI